MNPPDLEMLFLLAVMVTAIRFGRGPSLLAAGLGVACYDFFFVPPFHTFPVQDRRYFLTFAMMFGVGIVMSELTGRLRRQEREALSRETRTAVLYALTRDLASADQPNRSRRYRGASGGRNVRREGLRARGISAKASSRPSALRPEDTRFDEKELGVAKWCHRTRRARRAGNRHAARLS